MTVKDNQRNEKGLRIYSMASRDLQNSKAVKISNFLVHKAFDNENRQNEIYSFRDINRSK